MNSAAGSGRGYDFSDLTVAQQYLLTFGGWHPDDKRPQPHRATVRKLIERGLLVEGSTMLHGVCIPTYTVPHAVHMAWCDYCASRGDAPKERRA